MSKNTHPQHTLPLSQEEASAHASPPATRSPVEARLEATQRLLHALTQVHAEFMVWGEHRVILERLLALTLELTRSELGFIGELRSTPSEAPSLRAHAISPADWTEALRGYAAPAGLPGPESSPARTLFEAMLGSIEPLQLQAPTPLPGSSEAPTSSPTLSHLLVLPFEVAGENVGRLALANRPGGYDVDLIDFLRPLITTCGTLLHAWRQALRHREAEQKLQAQQQQLRKLALVAARTDNAVIITDATGVIEWVNEGFTRITGYTLEEVQGQKPGKLLQGPDTDPKSVEAMRQALIRGEGITVELLNYGKNGRPYWNLIEVQPVRDEQGRLVHFVAIESDVTARRTLEQQAAKSEERLRLALESAEDGLWDWDVPTGRMTVSPRWLRMLGYEEGEREFTVTTWSEELCHPEDLPEAERRLTEHMAGRTPMFEFEHRLRHRNGSVVWVLGRAKVVARNERGRPLRIVGTNVDITSRKLAEERLRAFNRAIPDMIFHLHLDGTFLDFKPSVLEPPNSPPETFIGRKMDELPLPAELIAHHKTATARLLQGSPLEVFEYSMELPHGRQYYEARMVRSGPEELACFVHNITERKAAEEQRRRHAEELAERVRQITQELEARQAQLIQAEKLASMGQMAASIAHEISNPVSYISSNVTTLESYVSFMRRLIMIYLQAEQALGDQPPEPVARLLGQARSLRQQERLEEMLQDLDDLVADSREGLNRIREFVQSLKTFVREESELPQRADLNNGLKTTLRMLRHELKDRCEVHSDFAPLPPLLCFPTQLNQVFMNLLLNAAQAIEQRGEIHVSTRQEGSEALIHIRDNGRGMDERTRARLFTPFFTTKPPGQGTGLGLTICYTIISRHKGRIEVQSEPGKGTTFTVRLPLAPT